VSDPCVNTLRDKQANPVHSRTITPQNACMSETVVIAHVCGLAAFAHSNLVWLGYRMLACFYRILYAWCVASAFAIQQQVWKSILMPCKRLVPRSLVVRRMKEALQCPILFHWHIGSKKADQCLYFVEPYGRQLNISFSFLIVFLQWSARG
jgi:hypothetical protein